MVPAGGGQRLSASESDFGLVGASDIYDETNQIVSFNTSASSGLAAPSLLVDGTASPVLAWIALAREVSRKAYCRWMDSDFRIFNYMCLGRYPIRTEQEVLVLSGLVKQSCLLIARPGGCNTTGIL